MSVFTEIWSVLRTIFKWAVIIACVTTLLVVAVVLGTELSQLIRDTVLDDLFKSYSKRVSGFMEMYQLYKIWAFIVGKLEVVVTQILTAVFVYAWMTVRSATGGRRIKPQPESIYRLIRERMMPGSELQPVKERNRYQADVYIKDGDMKPIYVGQCFRYDDLLLTAGHVLSENATFIVSTKSGEIELNPKKIHEFGFEADDLAYYQMDAAETALLGLRSVRLVSDSSMRMNVEVSSRDSKTIGLVESMENVFGQVSYDGSTVPGFSGAPYMVGSKCFGLHVGSAAINIGYDSGYLKALLQDRHNEDTADFLSRLIDKGTPIKAKRLPSSDYLVKARGRFYRLSEHQFNKNFIKETALSYDDSGNGLLDPPQYVSVGVPGPDIAQTDAQTEHICESSGTQQSPSGQLEEETLQSPIVDMELLRQTHAQLSAVLSCTPGIITLETSHKGKGKKRSPQRKKSTRSGGLSPSPISTRPLRGQ